MPTVDAARPCSIIHAAKSIREVSLWSEASMSPAKLGTLSSTGLSSAIMALKSSHAPIAAVMARLVDGAYAAAASSATTAFSLAAVGGAAALLRRFPPPLASPAATPSMPSPSSSLGAPASCAPPLGSPCCAPKV